jgi:hypothetical protein
MATIITVTKFASAYIDLEKDTPVPVNAEFISKMLPVNEAIEIGATILFFYDGTTMNIAETVSQVYQMVQVAKNAPFNKSSLKISLPQ